MRSKEASSLNIRRSYSAKGTEKYVAYATYWYYGFGPWTQHGLYSINTGLGELIIVVYVVLKLLTLLFTTPMTNFIFDIY